MDALYAAPDSLADGRIQLMTMHKAKGLEFDTVILPGLGRRPRGATPELLYWLERPTADGDVSLLMAPIRAAASTLRSRSSASAVSSSAAAAGPRDGADGGRCSSELHHHLGPAGNRHLHRRP